MIKQSAVIGLGLDGINFITLTGELDNDEMYYDTIGLCFAILSTVELTRSFCHAHISSA